MEQGSLQKKKPEYEMHEDSGGKRGNVIARELAPLTF